MARIRCSPGFVKTAEQFQAANPTYKTESSLAYWFVTPKTPVPPPKWKMSIVTLLGVWPLSMLVPKVIGPIIKHMNPIMSAFCFCMYRVLAIMGSHADFR